MTETGCVVSTSGGFAVISIPMKGACKSCGLCVTGEGGRNMTLTALNRVGAVVGETVEVEVVGRRILSAAFVVYIVPVIATIVGFLVGRAVAHGDESSDLPIGMAVAFLAASFIVIWVYDLRVRKTDKMHATVTRVILPDEATGPMS